MSGGAALSAYPSIRLSLLSVPPSVCYRLWPGASYSSCMLTNCSVVVSVLSALLACLSVCLSPVFVPAFSISHSPTQTD